MELPSPILDRAGWAAFLDGARQDRDGRSLIQLDTTWRVAEGAAGLAATLDHLARAAVRAARSGAAIVALTDMSAGRDRLPVPSILAVGAVHTALTNHGLRAATDVAVDAGDAFDVHGVAMLIAAGASAVHPRTAIELAVETAGSRGNETLAAEAAEANLVEALEMGLRKVLARMGISTLASYRGSQLFEAIGLDPALVERCFPAAAVRAGTADAARLGGEIVDRHRQAYDRPVASLPDPGFVRFRGEGETHAFAPVVVKATQALAAGHSLGVGPGAALAMADETHALDERLAAYRAATARTTPLAVRELLEIRPAARHVPLSQVERLRRSWPGSCRAR